MVASDFYGGDKSDSFPLFLLVQTIVFLQFVLVVVYSSILLYSYSSPHLNLFLPIAKWPSFPFSFFLEEGQYDQDDG